MKKDDEKPEVDDPESVPEFEKRTKKRASTRIKKDIFLRCLEVSMCVISTASLKAGIERKTYYNWIKVDKQFVEECKMVRELLADFGEIQLHKQMRNGNSRSTIFFLKTQCKDRGYGDDLNVNITGEVITAIKVVTKEELDAEKKLKEDVGFLES